VKNHAPIQASSTKPNTQASTGIDQKEKKIYELYASTGKTASGMAPIGTTPFA
jgi:hypothetical protein